MIFNNLFITLISILSHDIVSCNELNSRNATLVTNSNETVSSITKNFVNEASRLQSTTAMTDLPGQGNSTMSPTSAALNPKTTSATTSAPSSTKNVLRTTTTILTPSSASESENSITCNENLSKYSNFTSFWLQTALASISMETNTSSCLWRVRTAARLLALCRAAVGADEGKNSTLEVLLVSVSRQQINSSSQRVRLVYIAEKNGSYVPADQSAALINRLDKLRVSDLLGYDVLQPVATVFLPDELASTFERGKVHDWADTGLGQGWQQLAMAAAAASGIVLVVVCLVSSAVLALYFGCLRPRHLTASGAGPGRRRRSGSRGPRRRCRGKFGRGGSGSWYGYGGEDDDDVDEEEVTGAGQSTWPVVAHMRANPKISYSTVGIEAIAEQVTRRLEAHMCELVLGWQQQQQQRQSTPTTSAGSPTPISPEVVGSNPFGQTLSDAELIDAAPSTVSPNRPAVDEELQVQLRRCPQATPTDSGACPNGKGRSVDSERASRRHSAVERQRNKERLRRIQVSRDDGSFGLRQQQPSCSVLDDHHVSHYQPPSRPRMPRLGLRAAAASTASSTTRRAESMLVQSSTSWRSPADQQPCSGPTAEHRNRPFLETSESKMAHL